MRERPILFQGAMVRAIIDGSKTQTRRLVKPQPEKDHDGEPYWFVGGYRVWTFRPAPAVPLRVGGNPLPCPYGQPSDRLWVRESLRQWSKDPQVMAYAADDRRLGEFHDMDWPSKCGDKVTKGVPSIHMPRAWSRILLEVTGVRVERLQDISETDAIAEGIEPDMQPGDPVPLWRNYSTGNTTISPVYSYQTLWESINGPGSWDANPWVWCVSFRRLP